MCDINKEININKETKWIYNFRYSIMTTKRKF